MKFDSTNFLKDHILKILSFYNKNSFDKNGGFFNVFLNDGSIFDKKNRHLVSGSRFVFNYANAYLMTKDNKYKELCNHGLEFIINQHRNINTNHFSWQITNEKVVDGRAMAYGYAFVILAGSFAFKIGIKEGKELAEEAWNFMNKYFWEEKYSAYADELSPDLKILNPYRGQNANMHTVEALIAAYEIFKEKNYLDRANLIAQQFAVNLASQSQNQIWEHYDSSWKIDWEYNKDKPDDAYRPWGFQPGHQVEWSKLLLQLNVHSPEDWKIERSIYLFEKGTTMSIDKEYGGLVYGYSPDGNFTNDNKYFWVQAEALAASWRLYKITNKKDYYNFYISLWEYCWKNFVDHKYGAWFNILTRKGKQIDKIKSPLGKTDYHTMGACWDIISNMP